MEGGGHLQGGELVVEGGGQEEGVANAADVATSQLAPAVRSVEKHSRKLVKPRKISTQQTVKSFWLHRRPRQQSGRPIEDYNAFLVSTSVLLLMWLHPRCRLGGL